MASDTGRDIHNVLQDIPVYRVGVGQQAELGTMASQTYIRAGMAGLTSGEVLTGALGVRV